MISAVLLLLPSLALAQVCPEKPPAGEKARKKLAGQWFERGQRAAEQKEWTEAMRAYRCSLSIVEHAFTAYNLALAAEKADDRAMALEGYRRYLALSPNAQDRAEVEQKLAALDPPPPPPPPAIEVAPPPPAIEPPSPPPPPIAAPAIVETGSPALRPAGFAILGAGAAVAIAAIVMNVVARSRADASRSAFADEEYDRADGLQGQARALAYSSYAGFAVGGAALAIGGVLLFVE